MYKHDPYMLKEGYIERVIKESENTYTFHILTQEQALPGQYNMLYAFGTGESPITIASKNPYYTVHTVRAVGDVTKHLDSMKEGDILYYRGPYGNAWSIEEAYNRDLLIISGGLGLAATRWVFEEAITGEHPINKVTHLYGSKDTGNLLYTYLYEQWAEKAHFEVIVGKPSKEWSGKVGSVVDLIKEVPLSTNTVVFMCGPDPMVKACKEVLKTKGVAEEDIYVSLERHMKCSVGTCGHCMIGPYFVCKDGPVFRYDHIKEFFEREEV